MAYEVALRSKALLGRLSKFESAISLKGLRSAMVGYAGPIKKEMKRRIRSVTGDLRKSIGHKSLTKREKSSLGFSGGRVVLAVGATRKVMDSRTGKKSDLGYKLHWLDAGTKRHDIKPNKKKRLKIGNVFVKIARHPGVYPRRTIDGSTKATAASSRQGFDKALARFLDKHA